MIQVRVLVTMASGRKHVATWADAPNMTLEQAQDPEAQTVLIDQLLQGTVLRMECEAIRERRPQFGDRPHVFRPARTAYLRTQHIEDIELQVREVRSGETTTHVEPTDEPDADVLG